MYNLPNLRLFISPFLFVISFTAHALTTVPGGTTVNNYELLQTQDYYVAGQFNNYGTLFTRGAFSITGDNGYIINHSDGNMFMTGYMDMYPLGGTVFENAGRFIAIDSLEMANPFTLLFRGIIKNTGTFLISKRVAQNACEQAGAAKGVILNYGLFEIANDTNCNFASRAETATRKASYIQHAGELKVNGYFAAHSIRINQGIISGEGTIEGIENSPLLEKVSLSPGDPIGRLSIIPKQFYSEYFNQFFDGYFLCIGCSTDIELAGATRHDHLHINGDLYLNHWNLNVVLREGYIPQQGDSFEIVSANLIRFFGQDPTYNLPNLPTGLSWDVYNDGAVITLTVN